MLFAELSTEVWLAIIGAAIVVINRTFSVIQMIVGEHLANKRAERVASKVEQVKEDLNAVNGDHAEKLDAIARAVNAPVDKKPSP